ncbi:alpha/beta hydrolase [Aurantiacibacter aquimixticola]|uniref:Alpha/beta hydrolase n=1 Tax=Aurantiacibacter aquimixticola TaxID=1958945 RepID=A0A419RWB1_9SPHN|nr:alpha/beta hydrolase [Aurantiacibacter aquimixticola]RJY10085.1 alpha/beta hydrolase [Aurantiacibacter aquimixticola]
MNRLIAGLLSLCALALAFPSAVSSREELPSPQLLRYGEEPLQEMLFWPNTQHRDAPLIAFVHGGGWSRGDMRTGLEDHTIAHWHAQGYAVASINYRLVPDVIVERQAGDVAEAVAMLIQRNGEFGIDDSRIVLAGHSAGAHLAALVGTDPVYFRNQGLAHDAVRGVLALDGAVYDIALALEGAGPRRLALYRNVFGNNPGRHRALSPVAHAAQPNVSDFLILHVERRVAQRQSEALADALGDAGTQVRVEPIPGRGMRGHMEINRRMGEPDYPATPVVDEWLARVLR